MVNEKIYQMKITLEGTRPHIWRRIQLYGYFNFNTLHCAIQDAMGWRHCHNYYFEAWNQKKQQRERIDPFDNVFDEGIPDNSVKIWDYFVNPKDKVYYEYDMGDSWAHSITLEKILPENKLMKYPKCLDGRRACPPEDAGGIYKYNYIVKILKDRKHPEYDHYKSWLKLCGYTRFNPEHFNPKNAFKHWKSKKVLVFASEAPV